ncbi:MAG: glycerol-3-phosphate dehydrogenase [Pseudomonadota bacterium]
MSELSATQASTERPAPASTRADVADGDIRDIAIIGGGINGCGIARDAVGRGYSVSLFEMGDLASGTSSWSSKLIHGGFRYLEYYEFRLVREALTEREVLLKSAPHIIWPLRFVLPHHTAMRPAWLLRLGLFLYDHMGRRKLLPGTRQLDLTTADVGAPLKDTFKTGFEYSDCWVDDARLVALNARDAADRGADIRTRTKCIAARHEKGHWVVTTQDLETGEQQTIRARLIVNAAGPWVDQVLGQALGQNAAKNVRLVQGSHIVVPRMHDHDRAYIFQNADNRIIFVIPYQRDFSLIGTTDRDYDGDPADVKATPEEIDYLCKAASEYFKKAVSPDDVVWTYSGVRPLYDDGATAAQEATRDYVLRTDGGDDDRPPVVNIFGGKITTYRKLAESMLEKIEAAIGAKGGRWTDAATLPGGDFPVTGYDALVTELRDRVSGLDKGLAKRLARAYGTKARTILSGIGTSEQLGRPFLADLYTAEVGYLVDHEWARSADDVLWRRSKLGLRASPEEVAALDAWIDAYRANRTADAA